MHRVLAVALVAALGAAAGAADLQKPIFYLPLDGTTVAAIAGGEAHPRHAVATDVLLAIVDARRKVFLPGRVGLCYEVGDRPLEFQCAGNFRPDEGACSFWLSPQFRGDDTAIYCTFFGAARWGMLYKYLKHTTLTFGTAKPDADIYYDCTARDIRSWRPGQWHHVAVCWSRRENARRIYVDGKLEARAPFPFHRPVGAGPLFIGSGCLLYPNHVAHGRMDEVAIWDRPLTADEVKAFPEAKAK